VNRPGGGNNSGNIGSGNIIAGNRPGINRPDNSTNINNRPILNRPNWGNNTVIGGGNTNINNRPITINRPEYNINNINNSIRQNTVVNKNIVNRVGPNFSPGWGGAAIGGSLGTVYPGVVGSVVAPASFPVAGPAYLGPTWGGYAPMGGFGHGGYGGWYDDGFVSPFASWAGDWQPNFWGGLAGAAANLLALNALSPSTVVYQNPYPVPVPVETATAAPATTPPPVPAELDYSRPIEVPTAKQAASLDEEIIQLGMRTFEDARTEFKKGNHVKAQDLVEKAIRLVPGDTSMHEVRALALFAQKKYEEAAGTLYAVLSVGPGSTWESISTLYPDQDTYAAQLHALEDSIRAGGNEPWRHFLLAYQYMVLDEREAALAEFRLAAQNEKDKVSPKLVALLEKALGKDATKEGGTGTPRGDVKEAGQAP
jgi:tetratricopeptide (TPR) repeat protein